MLNFEQLLIKAAQYLDFDLEKLQIKQTVQKRRIITRDNLKEKYDEILHSLLQEIHYFEANPDLKDIVYEFLNDYDYVQREIYGTYEPKLEKRYDWLLLKYFVIPYFAFSLSRHFTHYDDRIDRGLPGGEFWYLPKLENKKLIFPLKRIMKWWIDLFGGSNENFYNAIPIESDITADAPDDLKNDLKEMDERRNLLKSWHDKFVIPSMRNIEKYSEQQVDYRGVFTTCSEASIQEQFNDATNFIKNVKKLNLDDLKLEFPNPDNLLDRLEEAIDIEEKERFVTYVKDRWQKPTQEQLKSILITTSVSQSAYKDLSKYFDSDGNSNNLSKNKLLQLCTLYSELYNFATEYYYGISEEGLNQYTLYIDYLRSFFESKSKKELLDRIISQISKEIVKDDFHLTVDEVLVLKSNPDQIDKEALERIGIKHSQKKKDEESEKLLLKTIHQIEHSKDRSEIESMIKTLDDFQHAVNAGQYFEGHNHLTDKIVNPRIDLSLKIYKHTFSIATTPFEKSYASIAIINLATFPLFYRLLYKEEVEYWFEQCAKYADSSNERYYLILLTKKAFHEVLQKNHTNAVSMIVEFLDKTKQMKIEDYNPELLCIGERVAKEIKNRKLEKILKKRNKHHKMCDFYRTSSGEIKDFFYY